MQTNNRILILEATTRVIERAGVTAVTFDAVARETGLTRGGVMYHFPSRRELLQALHEHQAAAWDATIAEVAGHAAQGASDDERLRAYVQACRRPASRAELQMLIEALSTPEHMAPWRKVIERWTAAHDTADLSAAHAVERRLAHLAADGLWMREALARQPLSAELRASLAELVSSPLDGPPGP